MDTINLLEKKDVEIVHTTKDFRVSLELAASCVTIECHRLIRRERSLPFKMTLLPSISGDFPSSRWLTLQPFAFKTNPPGPAAACEAWS